VSDFLDDRRKEITDRLKELKPAVDEFNRLEDAVEALAGLIGSAASEVGSAAVATVTRRRKKGPGRPRGSGKRARKATQTSTQGASTSGATVAITADAPPAAAEPKRPGRPKGSGKKVGRPPGSGKKSRPPRRQSWSSCGQSWSSQRQSRTSHKASGARALEDPFARAGAAGHHDPRAGGEDGDQAELSLPRASRPRAGRQATEERPWLVPEGLALRSIVQWHPSRNGIPRGFRSVSSRRCSR